MKETIAAQRGIFGMPAPGAFSRVKAAARPEGTVGTMTDSTAVPTFSVPERISVVRSLGQPPFGQAASRHTAVREHYNYTTRVIPNGGGAAGPHRWRAPV